MSKTLLTMLSLTFSASSVLAGNFFGNEPLTLDVEPMSPEVMRIINQPLHFDLTERVGDCKSPTVMMKQVNRQ